jgi:hypothetical protein
MDVGKIMNTNELIVKKLGLDFNDTTRMPLEIPNFGRQHLAELFNNLGFRAGAEIGVREGEYSEVLCKANPHLKLYGIDPYIAYTGYRDHIQNEPFEDYYKQAAVRLAPYDYEFVKKFSLEAIKDFEDKSLDFVYIDGNHDFKNCTNDIAQWTKKVKEGGIISGHDYTKHRRPTNIHCYEVVNGYTSAYNIKPWFITSSKVVHNGTETVEARSWFWVNLPFESPRGNRE